MPEPTFHRATLTIQSFGTSADELRDRVRRTVETHPTLSFRVDRVEVEPWDAPSAELAHLSDGEFYRELDRRRLRQGHHAPSDLRPSNEPPPNNVKVVLWLSDRSVAIEFYPVVAYNSPEFGKPMWWSGIPGQYVRMGPLDGSNGWTIEGWTPLPSTLPSALDILAASRDDPCADLQFALERLRSALELTPRNSFAACEIGEAVSHVELAISDLEDGDTMEDEEDDPHRCPCPTCSSSGLVVG